MDRGMGNNMGSPGGMGMMNSSNGGGMGGMDRGMDRGMGSSIDRMGSGMDRGMGDNMGMSGSMGGGGGYGNSNQNSGGMFGGSSGGVRRSDSIMVRNLPMDCNWHTLKDRFNHAGDIKYAEMKDRGVGIIRFGSERDAERAVSIMNGQRIDGRSISVSLYQKIYIIQWRGG